jgi:phage terminase small subunit
MAGKPGRSGGARVGAGRKPRAKPVGVDSPERDPLEFLLDVMQGKVHPSPDQLKAAIAATQYTHAKRGEGGKKEAKQDAAVEAAAGRFRPKPPPLRAVK